MVEINEAFAAVALHASRMLDLDEEVVNVNGGAVALGHPIGASGARLVLTAAMEMRRRGAELGAVAICGGGGQGDALVLRGRCRLVLGRRQAVQFLHQGVAVGRRARSAASTTMCSESVIGSGSRDARCRRRRAGTP